MASTTTALTVHFSHPFPFLNSSEPKPRTSLSFISHVASPRLILTAQQTSSFENASPVSPPPLHLQLSSFLRYATERKDLHLLRAVQALHTKLSYEMDDTTDIRLSNMLIEAYISFGLLLDARKVLDEMPLPNAYSFFCLISAYAKQEGITRSEFQSPVRLFHIMRQKCIRPNCHSLTVLVTDSMRTQNPLLGCQFHAYSIKSGLELDTVVATSLLSFYMKYGSVDNMLDLFDRMPVKDITAWNAMFNGLMHFGLVDSAIAMFEKFPKRDLTTYSSLMTGFSKNGDGKRGWEYFIEMVSHGVPISYSALTGCINLCAIMGDREKSRQIHGFIIKCGCKPSPQIGSALIDMCAKCGRTRDAHKLFDKWSRDEESFNVAFNSILSSYVREGRPEEAVSLFLLYWGEDDYRDSLFLDEFVMTTIIGACGWLGFTDMGKQMHCFTIKSGMACAHLNVSNALISMYAKCGDSKHATQLFDEMSTRDQVSWNALMSAHLLQQQGDKVLSLWSQMKRVWLQPDSCTFTLVMTACRCTTSNSLDTCREIFISMKNEYDMEPRSEHYAAMIEVLGFWDRFDEAEKLLNEMPFKPDSSFWRSLLRICEVKPNPILAKRAMQNIVAYEPKDEATYILAANLWAASSRWYYSERFREEMREKGMRKIPVRSWLVHDDAVHLFYTRDKSHPLTKDIYGGLDVLLLECMRNGYEPDTSCVLHEVEEYQKIHFLLYHSAKLAIMYGILVARHGESVRVMKNVRLCRDCHSFAKHASVLSGREISVRDTSGFHVFKHGVCSCRDCW